MPSSGQEDASWHELRSMLTGPEQRQLAQIFKRLDDPVRRAEELADALPDALSLSVAKDGRIARALQPTMHTVLKTSVRKNPKALADAIFPALGPAIRKAISATLMGMVQSLNHVLNQSFSLQGLKWRIEALRTQRPFAEVVLLHTLVYRVEQIYLIHRHTGIVLEHADSSRTNQRDPDLVSGMLTAIQDFVKDSFDVKSGEILDTLRMDGDHSVWIEQGEQVIMAVVIRGTPPLELRSQFRELLDKVHGLFADTLHNFDGQVASFGMIKPDLEDALVFKVRSDKYKISPLFWILVAATMVVIGFFSLNAVNNHRHWQHLLSQLNAEKGLVVTTVEKRGGRYYVSGLKDPLARDPREIISASKVNPDKVRTSWQPYHAVDDGMVLHRARKVLEPPESVALTFSHGMLTANGRAQHEWVRQFRKLAATIAGVHTYDDKQLTDVQMDHLHSAVAELEAQSIHFKLLLAQVKENQDTTLQAVMDTIQRIQNLSRIMQISVKIAVIGHTDHSGRLEFNMQLSRQRAQVVLGYLIRNGADPNLLDAIGAGPKPALDTASSARNHGALRHVSFKTLIIPE
jgi:OOP family OmpA-OmpF porin